MMSPSGPWVPPEEHRAALGKLTLEAVVGLQHRSDVPLRRARIQGWRRLHEDKPRVTVCDMGAPDWDHLFQAASDQDGYFTTVQAREAGYSTQLLLKYIRNGRVRHIRRGIYRLVHFPAGEHEDLSILWLWSEQEGVFSNVTALALHGLSDALPANIHLTLPASWNHRRLRVPEGLVLHFADVHKKDRIWVGPVPVTSVQRTLIDCAEEKLSPELLRQAAREALERGVVAKSEIRPVEVALKPFGGIAG